MKHVLPPGIYWVGDLCYVMHGEWEEVCTITIVEGERKGGVFSLADGRKFAFFGTAFGDGIFTDDEGNEYGVDAGNIGCIKVGDIDATNEENHITSGAIHIMRREFECSYEEVGGIIAFGNVSIATDMEDEDEDEEEED